MNIDTIPVSFIIKPLSFKDVAINVPEFSVSTSFVEPPVAFVLGTIFPDLDTVSMFHISQPLACIGGSVLEKDLALLLKLGFINVVHVEIRVSVNYHVALASRAIVIILLEAVVRIQLIKVSANSFSSDHTARPTL